MSYAVPTQRRMFWISRALAVVTLAALAPAATLAGGDAPKGGDSKPGKKKSPDPVEVSFVDDSFMKVYLQDERIELETPHGKLLIPVKDIHHIELAWRAPEDVARRASAAVADLGHKDFKRRQAATDELIALGEQAIPYVLKAAGQKEAEVTRRVHDVLKKLRETVPAERWRPRPNDIVITEHAKYSGRLNVTALKVKTFQFGELQVKLCDLRGMRFPRAARVPTATTYSMEPTLPQAVPLPVPPVPPVMAVPAVPRQVPR